MTIKVLAKGSKKAEVLVFGTIGADWFGEGVTAPNVKKDLDALGEVDDITVRINSVGGNVWDGLAIFNMLKEHDAKVRVQVEGLAASAASLIAMAGDTIAMGEGALMMIHNPATFAFGDADAMRKTGEVLDKIEAQFVNIYARRTGGKAEEIDKMMAGEKWFDAAEAIEHGFADEQMAAPELQEDEELIEESEAGWSKQILAMFKNAPKKLRTAAKLGPLNKFSVSGIDRIAAAFIPNQSANPDATRPKEDTMGDNATASVQPADIQKSVDAAMTAEATRRTDIKTAFGRFKDEHRELYDACIDDMKCSADAARAKLLAKLGEGAKPVGEGSVVLGADSRDKMRIGMGVALAVRLGLQKPEQANEFHGKSLCDMAEICLRVAGHSVLGLTKDGIARKVLAAHTTSDFPQLLSNTAGKVLRAAYDAFEHTWRAWCLTGSVSDFKVHPRIQLGSFSGLATIPEGGEYTYGTISESYETAQALTKGKAISFTRQMLVNDDLGGFNRRAQLMGDAAARTVNTDVYTYLTSGSSNHGPTTLDAAGQYFNATAVTTAGGHANLTSSGTAISVASLGVGRTAMRKQKDSGLLTTLNIQPKILLTPVGKEDLAKEIVTSTTKDGQSNSNQPNVLRNMFDVVSDPFLDGISATAWYLFAPPGSPAAGFEVVFLDGNQTPFIDDMVDFDTDALKFKVRLDYGVAIGDWRGGYKNVGA